MILIAISKNRRSLADMIAYAIDPAKTSPELIFGQGINPMSALADMELAASLWASDRKHRPYWQYILSFDADVREKLPLATVKEVAQKVGLLLFPEHQILAAIHVNKQNWHVHYVVNAINLYTGRQFRQGESLFSLKQKINQLLAEYDLPPIHCYETQKNLVPN